MFHLQNGFRLKAGFSKHSCMPLARLGPTNGRAWRFNGFNGKTSPSQQMNLNPQKMSWNVYLIKILFASNFAILPSLSPEFKDTPYARPPPWLHREAALKSAPPIRHQAPKGFPEWWDADFLWWDIQWYQKMKLYVNKTWPVGRLIVDAKWCKHCGTSLIVSDYGLLYIEIMNEASSSWPHECWLIM